MATRRTQGMSPATSLMGAARQFGKVGARGSGNKSVQPGGKNKPVPGLSPSTNPRIQGVQKMPEPMRPAGAAVYPGGLPKFPTGGAQVKPSVGTQPMQGPMAKRGSHGGGGEALTGRQRRIIRKGARKALDVEGDSSPFVRNRLRRGIKKKGITQRERVAMGLVRAGIIGRKQDSGASYKQAKKAANRWRRSYKRAQG